MARKRRRRPFDQKSTASVAQRRSSAMHITDIAKLEDTSASLQPANVLRIALDETRSNHESGAVRCHFRAIKARRQLDPAVYGADSLRDLSPSQGSGVLESVFSSSCQRTRSGTRRGTGNLSSTETTRNQVESKAGGSARVRPKNRAKAAARKAVSAGMRMIQLTQAIRLKSL